MKIPILMVGLLTFGAVAPVASAETFCPDYNADALANCSISVDAEDRDVFVPEPTLAPKEQCIIGEFCVPYFLPGDPNWESFGNAPVPRSSGYVEATGTCPPSGGSTMNLTIEGLLGASWTPPYYWHVEVPCRVEWDTYTPPNQVVQ